MFYIPYPIDILMELTFFELSHGQPAATNSDRSAGGT